MIMAHIYFGLVSLLFKMINKCNSNINDNNDVEGHCYNNMIRINFERTIVSFPLLQQGVTAISSVPLQLCVIKMFSAPTAIICFSSDLVSQCSYNDLSAYCNCVFQICPESFGLPSTWEKSRH